jgi:ABC-type branched-subunit amino acid transport system substrate-binding protein
MIRMSRRSILAVVLVSAVSLAACAPRVSAPSNPANPQGGGGGGSSAQVDPTQPVTVAVLTPQTASNAGAARLGKALANAARMAAADAGQPNLKLKIYDTRGEAGTARASAERAIAAGAKLIIGPLFGANTRAIASLAAARGVKVISFSTDSSIAGDPVYLSGFLPEVAAQRISQFARSRGYSTLGVLYPQTAYGQTALSGAQSSGVPIVTSIGYPRTNDGIPPATSQFSQEVRQNGAQAVLLAESGQALQYVGALINSNGVSRRSYKYLGLGEWDSKLTLQEGSLLGGWFPAPDPTQMRNFVEKYQRAYQSVPPSLAVLGYDAVQMAAQMLATARRDGSTDVFGAQAITRPEGFRGAVGPIRFRPDGVGVRGMAVLEVGQGTFTLVDPAPPSVGLGS